MCIDRAAAESVTVMSKVLIQKLLSGFGPYSSFFSHNTHTFYCETDEIFILNESSLTHVLSFINENISSLRSIHNLYTVLFEVLLNILFTGKDISRLYPQVRPKEIWINHSKALDNDIQNTFL
jgi:hypothetical protein